MRSFKVVKPGGKLVSVSELPDEKFAKGYGLNIIWQKLFKLGSYKIRKASQKDKADYEFLFMHLDGKQLQKLGKLVADKKLEVRFDKEFAFSDLQAACDYVATGHANGKTIIDVAR